MRLEVGHLLVVMIPGQAEDEAGVALLSAAPVEGMITQKRAGKTASNKAGFALLTCTYIWWRKFETTQLNLSVAENEKPAAPMGAASRTD